MLYTVIYQVVIDYDVENRIAEVEADTPQQAFNEVQDTRHLCESLRHIVTIEGRVKVVA